MNHCVISSLLCGLIALNLVSGRSTSQCSSPLATSVNDFGFGLSKQIGGSDNLFISPLSIYTALAITYLGSGGKTAGEIARVFRLESNGLTGNKLHESFQELMEMVRKENDEYSLLMANGIFLQYKFNVKQRYIDDTLNFYRAVVKVLNFVEDGEGAKKVINQWAAQNTRNKIPEFLKQPLDKSTVAALMNAVYFKGTWKTQFPKGDTTDGVFYKSSSEQKQVKMMVLRSHSLPYLGDRQMQYQFVELPYKGEHISMLLALPVNHFSFPDLVLNSQDLCDIRNKMSPTKLDSVIIPKYSLKYRKELVSTLQQMGINDLFISGANLTGISDDRNLAVSRVVHEAVIDVNEEGSEAAAVTGVFLTRLSLPIFPRFIANHPFLFYVIDNRNGLVLFSGRVSDP